jgi:hypothetical protein
MDKRTTPSADPGNPATAVPATPEDRPPTRPPGRFLAGPAAE